MSFNQMMMKEQIKTPLTDRNMREIYPPVRGKIMEYSELSSFNDLEEILPEHHSFVIILIEYEQNSGHWICLSRYGDTIEFFNSYGTRHGARDFVESKSMNRYLGQAHMHLKKLLLKEASEQKFDVIYNQVKFQKRSLKVNTCGRHVLTRLICLLEFDMTLEDYIAFMRRAKKKTGLSYDELAVYFIPN